MRPRESLGREVFSMGLFLRIVFLILFPSRASVCSSRGKRGRGPGKAGGGKRVGTCCGAPFPEAMGSGLNESLLRMLGLGSGLLGVHVAFDGSMGRNGLVVFRW